MRLLLLLLTLGAAAALAGRLPDDGGDSDEPSESEDRDISDAGSTIGPF